MFFATPAYAQTAGGSTDPAALIQTFGLPIILFVLFYFLMRLDLQDSSICTIIVFIMIASANYAAYRAEMMMKGSWL